MKKTCSVCGKEIPQMDVYCSFKCYQKGRVRNIHYLLKMAINLLEEVQYKIEIEDIDFDDDDQMDSFTASGS